MEPRSVETFVVAMYFVNIFICVKLTVLNVAEAIGVCTLYKLFRSDMSVNFNEKCILM